MNWRAVVHFLHHHSLGPLRPFVRSSAAERKKKHPHLHPLRPFVPISPHTMNTMVSIMGSAQCQSHHDQKWLKASFKICVSNSIIYSLTKDTQVIWINRQTMAAYQSAVLRCRSDRATLTTMRYLDWKNNKERRKNPRVKRWKWLFTHNLRKESLEPAAKKSDRRHTHTRRWTFKISHQGKRSWKWSKSWDVKWPHMDTSFTWPLVLAAALSASAAPPLDNWAPIFTPKSTTAAKPEGKNNKYEEK